MIINQFDLRLTLRNYCGKYPQIFQALYSLKSINRKLLVNKSTQLLIEGFPRSANTFAVLTFQYANKNINIAHHLHIPSQVFQAVKWKIPILILIRNPKDAVASWLLRNPGLSANVALKNYISFYQLIQPHKSKFVVAKFEEVITDYGKVIERVNTKFDTSFVPITPNINQKQEIFAQINRINLRTNGFDSKLKSSRPWVEKNILKQQILQNIKQNTQDSLAIAEAVYCDFTRCDSD